MPGVLQARETLEREDRGQIMQSPVGFKMVRFENFKFKRRPQKSVKKTNDMIRLLFLKAHSSDYVKNGLKGKQVKAGR